MKGKILAVHAHELKRGDVVLKGDKPLYVIAEVMKAGFHVEVIAEEGFPVKLMDLDQLTILRG